MIHIPGRETSPKLTIVHSDEEPPETYASSIFLAGPSPRGKNDLNWRPEAIERLRELGYTGIVFVPLPSTGGAPEDYDNQVGWETRHLHRADQIAFWVPRSVKKLPGFTTNAEWGFWCSSGKCRLGYPDDAEKMRFLQYHADLEDVPSYRNLRELLAATVDAIGPGAERTGGERDVPLHIWKTAQFQAWYQSQTAAGNRLDGAKVLWTFRVGPKRNFVFAFALHVDIRIASEGRNKTNEFIIGRPDIGVVVAYHRPDGAGPEDIEVALVREFRSPARTSTGFILESPGGSSFKPNKPPLQTAAEELGQETGLVVDPQRLRKVGSRQTTGTLSTHQAHVFAAELTAEEMTQLKSEQAAGTPHGVASDTERTYVEVHRLADLLKADSDLVDWSTLGMVLSALAFDAKE